MFKYKVAEQGSIYIEQSATVPGGGCIMQIWYLFRPRREFRNIQWFVLASLGIFSREAFSKKFNIASSKFVVQNLMQLLSSSAVILLSEQIAQL